MLDALPYILVCTVAANALDAIKQIKINVVGCEQVRW